MNEFAMAMGSVPGTDHTKPGEPGWTNNHDACTMVVTDHCRVVVVADGCGSGAHSEVGSKIGVACIANFLAAAVGNLANSKSEPLLTDQFWDRVKSQVVAHLTVLANAMGGSLTHTVNNYFLFAFVGVLILKERTYIFSFGDGIYAVNGEVVVLGPFPGNAPPYLMYNLTGSTLAAHSPEQLKIQVDRILPTDELEHCAVGSDGVVDLISIASMNVPGCKDLVGPLEQYWTKPFYTQNPDGIRRHLARINKEMPSGDRVKKGLLRDDTTLAVVVRVSPSSEQGG
jgi:hypothetical protein